MNEARSGITHAMLKIKGKLRKIPKPIKEYVMKRFGVNVPQCISLDPPWDPFSFVAFSPWEKKTYRFSSNHPIPIFCSSVLSLYLIV